MSGTGGGKRCFRIRWRMAGVLEGIRHIGRSCPALVAEGASSGFSGGCRVLGAIRHIGRSCPALVAEGASSGFGGGCRGG